MTVYNSSSASEIHTSKLLLLKTMFIIADYESTAVSAVTVALYRVGYWCTCGTPVVFVFFPLKQPINFLTNIFRLWERCFSSDYHPHEVRGTYPVKWGSPLEHIIPGVLNRRLGTEMSGRSWGGAEMTGRRWEGAEMTGIRHWWLEMVWRRRPILNYYNSTFTKSSLPEVW